MELTGIKRRQIRRLDKFNELISELQTLVSFDKIGASAVYELAFFVRNLETTVHSPRRKKIARLKQSEAKELGNCMFLFWK